MKLVPKPFTEALRSGRKQIGLWVSLSCGSDTALLAKAQTAFLHQFGTT